MTHVHRIWRHCLRLAGGAVFAATPYGVHASSTQSLEIHNSTITNSQTGPNAKAEMNLGSLPVLPQQKSSIRSSAVVVPPSASSQHTSFQNTSLEGRRWARARMDGMSLINVSAIAIDLSSASLRQLHAVNTDFTGARLANSDLRDASFENCNFAGADLRGARLDNARFSNVDWAGADLSEARWSNGRICSPGSVGTCLGK